MSQELSRLTKEEVIKELSEMKCSEDNQSPLKLDFIGEDLHIKTCCDPFLEEVESQYRKIVLRYSQKITREMFEISGFLKKD